MNGDLLPCSYCNTNPHSWKSTSERIDYIFHRSSRNHKTVIEDSFINLKKLNNTYLSDHFSLLAQVQLIKEAHRSNDQRRKRAIQILNKIENNSELIRKIKKSSAYIQKLIKVFNNPANQSNLTTW